MYFDAARAENGACSPSRGEHTSLCIAGTTARWSDRGVPKAFGPAVPTTAQWGQGTGCNRTCSGRQGTVPVPGWVQQWRSDSPGATAQGKVPVRPPWTEFGVHAQIGSARMPLKFLIGCWTYERKLGDDIYNEMRSLNLLCCCS